MNLAHARLLADHLDALRLGRNGYITLPVAEAIIADPQAHVDALVAAGVLERFITVFDEVDRWYKVVNQKPPHVHVWRGLVRCECGKRCDVPPTLPIEGPS
jgi:hypothetical protein